ncbi:MAG TPA: YeeE/YedE thiosulfate transporter family protein [Fimbriimonas sp.]
MGPFVPNVISDQLNLVLALLIGVAFGFVLEQAGFSSSRRLAGLFYGYDFTVLRVFFTAAGTAMTGILLLGYFGYLDLSAIYVNPTWLWPAIVGGIVMGVGFILGGYCPGTSVAAAAIGKIDAWWFVIGGIVGVLAYGEAYPLIQGFSGTSSLGPVRVYDSIGVSPGFFAFALILVAVIAFAATTWIEQRVNRDAPTKLYDVRLHRIAGFAAVMVGIALAVLPDRKTALLAEVSSPAYQASNAVPEMDADELAFLLVDQDPELRIYDLRGEKDYDDLTLPRSIRVSLDDMLGREITPDLARRSVRKVFVAESENEARVAALLASKLGYERASVLKGGFGTIRREYFSEEPLPEPGDQEQAEIRDWKLGARAQLRRQILEAKRKGTARPKKEKKIAGGC